MDNFEDYIDQVKAYVERTPMWKRWFLWVFLRKDYCPRCNRVTRWRFESINLGGDGLPHPDGVPVITRLTCRTCNLSTPYAWSPPFKEAFKDLEGEIS